jgi:hypothetical protein
MKAIIAQMEAPYRDIATRKGIIFPPLDQLHSGRAVETIPLDALGEPTVYISRQKKK